jgi:hypothetical protein
MAFVHKVRLNFAIGKGDYERLVKLHSLEKKKCSLNSFFEKIVSNHISDRNRDLLKLAEGWKDSDFD